MSGFKFRLQALQTLYESERDQKRLELADAYRAEEMLLERRTQLEEKVDDIYHAIRSDNERGEIDPDRLLNAKRFVQIVRSQLREIKDQVEQVREEVDRRLQRLVESNRQVKMMEKLEERQRDEFDRQARIRENKQLDEIAQQQFFVQRRS